MNASDMIRDPQRGGLPTVHSEILRMAAVSLLLPCLLSAPARAVETAVGKLEQVASSQSVSLPLALGSLEQVVGFQFDLVVAESQATAGFPVLKTTSDHLANSTSPAAGRRRLAVHSPSNSALPATLDLRVPILLLAGAPSGGPSIALKNLIFTDAAGKALPVSVTYSGIEQWRRDHFTEQERLDPEIIGDDKDPDQDGAANLAEFYRGSSPRVADPGPLLQVVNPAPADPGSLLKVRYWKAKNGIEGEVSAWAEASFDLRGWDPSAVRVQATGAETSSALELEASLDAPFGDAPRSGFIRIAFKRD
jgi:hypothetical protein